MKIENLLQQSGIERLDTEILLADLLDVNRAYLYTHPGKILTPAQIKAFTELCQRRRLGEPVAYLTGKREFWSMILKVSSATLIPRPETELLIETALNILPSTLALPILELGTGSGAISVALAKERPDWRIIAIDNREDAIAIAKENALTHGIKNIDFVASDWLNALKKQHFSAIISNPPYIALGDPHLKAGDLRYEPIGALASGKDGLDAIRFIIQQAEYYIVPGGWLLLEHGFDQKAQIQALMQRQKFTSIETEIDINKHPRVTVSQVSHK